MSSSCTDQCPICYEDLRKELCVTDPCGHVFHRKCFNEWANQSVLARTKCPTCNKNTDGAIDIFLEVSGFNIEVLDENGEDNVLHAKMKEMSSQLRAYAKEVAQLKGRVQRNSEIESMVKDIQTKLRHGKFQIESLKGDIKNVENQANLKVQNIIRQSTIVQHGLRSENSKLKTENEALRPMQQDHSRISTDNQRMKRKLYDMEAEIKKKSKNSEQLVRCKKLLKEANDKIKRTELRGGINDDDLKNENRRLKAQLNKFLEEQKQCVIEDVGPQRKRCNSSVRNRHPDISGHANRSNDGVGFLPSISDSRARQKKADRFLQGARRAISQESGPPVVSTNAPLVRPWCESSNNRVTVARNLWIKDK